jgi:hypothetical protein
MQFIIQKKYLILSILFFLFSCFLFIFLYKSINENKELAQLAQEKWEVETIERNNAKSLINSIEIIAPERVLLDKHFIQSSDVVPFLDKIEKLAIDTKVRAEVSSVDISNEDSSLIVELRVKGSFESIYKLILLLENSPYNLKFVLVNIQNSNNIEGLPTVKSLEWSAVFRIKLLSFIK